MINSKINRKHYKFLNEENKIDDYHFMVNLSRGLLIKEDDKLENINRFRYKTLNDLIILNNIKDTK